MTNHVDGYRELRPPAPLHYKPAASLEQLCYLLSVARARYGRDPRTHAARAAGAVADALTRTREATR